MGNEPTDGQSVVQYSVAGQLCEQIPFCNFCREAIFRDEGTPVKIEKESHIHQFYFHNTLT